MTKCTLMTFMTNLIRKKKKKKNLNERLKLE